MKSRKDQHQQVSLTIIWYKFILGITEVILGLSIAIFGHRAQDVYQQLQNNELFDDPHDLLANLMDQTLPYITVHRVSIVTILLLIGVVKIISCIAILKDQDWGAHLLLFLMLVLLPFDLFHLITHLDIGSLLLNAINLWIILSITEYHPYKYTKIMLRDFSAYINFSK